MKWRLLFRIGSLLLAGRVAARRRASARAGGRPAPMSRGGILRRIAGIRRDVGIAAQAVTLGVLLAAAGVLLTAGTSSTVLAPRWLGLVLLAFGAVALVAAFREGRGLRRAVMRRRLERRDEQTRGQM